MKFVYIDESGTGNEPIAEMSGIIPDVKSKTCPPLLKQTYQSRKLFSNKLVFLPTY